MLGRANIEHLSGINVLKSKNKWNEKWMLPVFSEAFSASVY
jgi:hypothetical protein